MSEYRKIAESSLDYLSKSTMFGRPLIEWIQDGLKGTPYDQVDIVAAMEDMEQRPLYEKADA